mmetsp:Transcript_17222/g.41366  ORF Transcript_17222/g.41366 Transcript_17222/m.41366 type:complete len:161 (-) Transcript_17222:953-1435(-)
MMRMASGTPWSAMNFATHSEMVDAVVSLTGSFDIHSNQLKGSADTDGWHRPVCGLALLRSTTHGTIANPLVHSLQHIRPPVPIGETALRPLVTKMTGKAVSMALIEHLIDEGRRHDQARNQRLRRPMEDSIHLPFINEELVRFRVHHARHSCISRFFIMH